MMKEKHENKRRKRLQTKKEYGLQIDLGQKLEEKVKNYTTLLKNDNNLKNTNNKEEKKNNITNFSFNSSSSGDYSNDYYEKFLIKLNSIKKSNNDIENNDLKNRRNISFKNENKESPPKKGYLTVFKETPLKIITNNLLDENIQIKSYHKSPQNINLRNPYKINLLKDNSNQCEKLNNSKIITDEIKSYYQNESRKSFCFHSPSQLMKKTYRFQSNIDEIENKNTKYGSLIKIKKNILNPKVKTLSITYKNPNKTQKLKREISLINENLKEKDKKSLIRKITNSLEITNYNGNINSKSTSNKKIYLLNAKKIDVENLLKRKKKNNSEKKEKLNDKSKDNSSENVQESKKETMIINIKKKKLLGCLPLC